MTTTEKRVYFIGSFPVTSFFFFSVKILNHERTRFLLTAFYPEGHWRCQKPKFQASSLFRLLCSLQTRYLVAPVTGKIPEAKHVKKIWRRRWRSKRFCKYGSFFTWKESRLMRSLAVISTLESSSPWPKNSALDIEAEPCNIPQVAFIIKKEWENVFFFQSCVECLYLLKTSEE